MRPNTIQRSYMYNLLREFLQFLLFILKMNDRDNKDLMLDEDDIEALEIFVRRMKDFDTFSIQLQADTTTLQNARIKYRGVSKRFAKLIERLDSNHQLL